MPIYAGGVSISQEVALKLAEHPNIIGMKDSTCNLTVMADIAQKTKHTSFKVIAGSASVFYPGLLRGCTAGIVCVFK